MATNGIFSIVKKGTALVAAAVLVLLASHVALAQVPAGMDIPANLPSSKAP